MVKWVKIFGDQYLGFWIYGLILFALQEVPYMVMPLVKLKSNPIMNMQESSVVLDICEKILGTLCIIVLTFIVQKDMHLFSVGIGLQRVGFFAAVAVLALNYVGWLLYFHGYQSVAIMMIFIVALPPLYYICIGLWRDNWVLLITGTFFEIVHFVHVFGSLKM